MVAQGTRPIRASATAVPDYQILLGQGRRGTQPVEHRQGGEQIADRGGEQDINPPPLNMENLADDIDFENVLCTTPIFDSLLNVYDVVGELMPFTYAVEMVHDMAVTKKESAFGAATHPGDSPQSWKEAMACLDSKLWAEAAQVKMDALIANGTWELVKLPKGCKEIGSQWVFLIKCKADGTIEQYKACLVAKGYSQIPGINYDQVFSPATCLTSL